MEQRPDDEMQHWLQFKNGDQGAFAAIYQQHIVSLIAYGLRLCPDRHVLKDQVQELFVELWNSRQNLAPTGSIKFYLFRALRYKLIRLEKTNHLRASTVRLAMDTGGSQLEQPIETRIIENETHESQALLLRRAIKALSLRQQEAIQLRYYQGFSHDQIAALMDLNYQSVSKLLHRTLLRLPANLATAATEYNAGIATSINFWTSMAINSPVWIVNKRSGMPTPAVPSAYQNNPAILFDQTNATHAAQQISAQEWIDMIRQPWDAWTLLKRTGGQMPMDPNNNAYYTQTYGIYNRYMYPGSESIYNYANWFTETKGVDLTSTKIYIAK